MFWGLVLYGTNVYNSTVLIAVCCLEEHIQQIIHCSILMEPTVVSPKPQAQPYDKTFWECKFITEPISRLS